MLMMQHIQALSLKKISFLQICLTLLFVVSMVVSNVITAKQVLLPFGITMTGAVFIFPITYILSDIFSEIYGYTWSRITCYFAFLSNLFMVIVFSIIIETPSPAYWLNQEAFEIVLGHTPRILFASLLAFIVGDFINDNVFKKMKEKHINSHKGFGMRAIISSFCGEFVDSLIFLPIAFFGQMPIETLLIMMVVQVSIKTGYEIIILPFTNFLVKKIGKYESWILNE